MEDGLSTWSNVGPGKVRRARSSILVPKWLCHRAYWYEHSAFSSVSANLHDIDNRGTWKSGGDVVIGCSQEGRDGYDMVEWVANQAWCNGKVTMAGNSYLAMTQWFTGAQRPPHLACLAPWEGWSDLFNDTVRRGGKMCCNSPLGPE
jgi:putative CocE/NonD family hydrolase